MTRLQARSGLRHIIRALGIAGAAALLLAAGRAPDAEQLFLLQWAQQPVDQPAVAAEVPPIVEEQLTFEEPELGFVVPEAPTLADMVAAVRRADDAIVLDRELQCLATAVYFEARGEPLEGQLAVAQVILRRVELGRFGADICAVVKAPSQFSFVRQGRMPQPRTQAQWETAQAIAVVAHAGAWREIVPRATHFHATRVNPGWRMARVATVGRHVFYRS